MCLCISDKYLLCHKVLIERLLLRPGKKRIENGNINDIINLIVIANVFNEHHVGKMPFSMRDRGKQSFTFSDALVSLALMVVTGSRADRNWRLAILHV